VSQDCRLAFASVDDNGETRHNDVILSDLLNRIHIKSTAEEEEAGGSNNGVNNNNSNNNERVVVAAAAATSRSIPPSLLDNLLVLPDTK